MMLPKKTERTQTARTNERDRLILEHLPLVKAIASRVHSTLPQRADLLDLIQAGVLGLFDAIDKYDKSKKVPFGSYAKYRIRGAILDSLRELDWASRDLRRRGKEIEAAKQELLVALKRMPTDVEVAERLCLSMERFHRITQDLHNSGLVASSRRTDDFKDLAAPEFPADPAVRPDHICGREELRSAVADAMQTLPGRYQEIVKLYYTDEMTMRQIGEKLGIGESRVSQIHQAALAKMSVLLKANGIPSSSAF